MYTLKKAPEIYILYFTLLDSKTRSKLGKKDYYSAEKHTTYCKCCMEPIARSTLERYSNTVSHLAKEPPK
jgi:hypothetical protein